MAQVVDDEGDSVMKIILPLLDRQTGMGRETWLCGSRVGTPAISALTLGQKKKKSLNILRLLDLSVGGSIIINV